MGSSNTKIHKWLHDNEISGRFLMLPPELFEYKEVQALSYAAAYFYIVLNAHKETEIQRACLYNALHEYNTILDLGMSEQDILDEARPGKRTKYSKGYFVAPAKQLYEQYGFKKNYVTKLKKELIEKGFIRIAYGGKGKYNGWNENVTVYQFTNKWKKEEEQNEVHHSEQYSTP